MLASAQVIGHQTGDMVPAGPAPNARNRREFALIGQEEITAGAQSAQAMAAHLLTISQPWGTLHLRQIFRNSAHTGRPVPPTRFLIRGS